MANACSYYIEGAKNVVPMLTVQEHCLRYVRLASQEEKTLIAIFREWQEFHFIGMQSRYPTGRRSLLVGILKPHAKPSLLSS